jgi:hypothetical protein
MAFHLDCAGRHGLVGIETKPAAYGEQDWMCDACKRRIPNNHIGVLHCRQCRCDICPECWTVLVPKIVNAAGYPCFWRQTGIHSPSVRMLGCHRANVGNFGRHVMHCGLDCPTPNGFCEPQPRTRQCVDCTNKQGELQALTASGGVAPPTASGVFAPPSASGVFAPPSASGVFAPPSASGCIAVSGWFPPRDPYRQQPPAINPACWLPPQAPSPPCRPQQYVGHITGAPFIGNIRVGASF